MSEKKMEATKVSIDRSIDKEDVVYSYTIECYSAKKRTKYLFFFAAVWTHLLSEVRQRQISYGITYMWNLKYDTNDLI